MSMMKSQANCYMNIYLLKENIDSKEIINDKIMLEKRPVDR
jgi:ferredoxin-thioredoxin reductase catalytic subunit